MNKLACLLALLGFAIGACTKVETVEATQVLLSVQSELGSEAVSYEARVTDTSEGVEGQRAVITKPPPFVFALVPPPGKRSETNLVVISALDAAGNAIAVTKTLVTFRDRLTLQVEVHFRQVCRARLCDPGFSCSPSITGAGECLAVQLMEGTTIEPGTTKPPGEMTMEGVTSGVDGGTGEGPVGATPGGASMGMAGGALGMGATPGGTAAGGSASGGADSGGSASGGSASGGSASGGSPSSGSASGGAATGGGAMMGGAVDVDAGTTPVPECDATRPCSAGYGCAAGKCVSLCAQTTCDPNATCSLNASNMPVCTCNSGYLTMTGAGGAVSCMKTQTCTELRCDTNATCEAMPDAQPRCVCRPGYTGNGMTCTPVSCPSLTLANGSVDTNGGTFGQTATFTCSTGYDRTGGSTRRCEANGTWSGTSPTCVAHNCGAPPAPARGSVSTTGGTTYGAVARYSCNSPFRVSPENTTRTCTATGWNGSTPSCVGCGDGEIQTGEQCDWASTADPWRCTTTCQRTSLYNSCMLDSDCGGASCYNGSCMTSCLGGQCPQLSSRATTGTMSCLGSFGCFLSCSRTSQCAPGTVCREGTCQGCIPTLTECPFLTSCIGESEEGLGRCQ